MNPGIPLTLLAGADGPEELARARSLARTLGCALVDAPPQVGLALRLAPSGLELLQRTAAGSTTVRADFVGGALGQRLRHGPGRRQPLGRAVGAAAGHRPRVLDATAGLGRDAMVLAVLGCEVLALERSAVVAALLRDGLDRAHAAGPPLADAAARVSLLEADARDWLAARTPAGEICSSPAPAVVLLDPMFPERRKSALVRKEMRLFRLLVGDDGDAGELLQLALRTATRRVVVKRPRTAEPLPAARLPDHAQPAGVVRYDIYLTPR